MPAGMGEQPTNKLGLRHRMVRVAEVDGEHKLVLFGRPTSGGPVVSRYTRLLDQQTRLQTKVERLRGRLGETLADDSALDRPYYVKPDSEERLGIDEMVATLAEHDVISFDIFDTALHRTVERPNDVFRIMGSRLGIDRFARIRKNAEGHARMEKGRRHGTREVTLREIYAVMEERYGAPPAWEEMEQALEVEVSRANPYIKAVFDRLIAMDKTIVFMSDMYLPRDVLEQMLVRNGFTGYEKVYVSNEYLRRKGDGTLQKVLIDNYGSETSIVHVGDVYEADVEKSVKAGLAAVYNPDQHQLVREPDMGNLAGSFYGALVDNTLGAGTWTEGLHYTHGYRVGGILALGFCEFIEQVVREKSVDKVLFCGRDCDVLSRVYERDYGSVDSAYIDISRYAVSGITLDLNFDDYIGRSFFRWFGESRNSKTIEQLMCDTGFDYLVPYLEQADIERFLFPASANRRKLEQFFWDHKAVIEEHNRTSKEAAKRYFENAVGDAQRVLIVDIGWSGTCLTALRHFFRTAMADRSLEVFGALMCTSRSEQLTDAVADGFISPYVYSPFANMDLTRFMMPGGRNAVRRTDLLHHPLEYLFTEVASSVVGYGFDEDGNPIALRGNNAPRNVEQISEMQRGIEDFVTAYRAYSGAHADIRPVSPYVAFNPLRAAIENEAYLYEVYKDFIYDATPALFGEETHTERFGDLFSLPGATTSNPLAIPAAGVTGVLERAESATPRRIVFISPEMIYAGAPRSLLRMCKVAAAQGFEPVVWTAKPGPFAKEFEAYGFRVEVVRTNPARPNKVFNRLPDGVELVVCNTVVTDDYVRALEGRVPVVWYVREASNLPDFFRSNPERRETLRHSKSVCVVSEYAAAAVAKYAEGPIEVVHNSVEDVAELAGPYEFEAGGKHRFIQLGTIEHRKGYDLFVAAYKSLPETYRERAELHFAGGFINSGSSFSSYLFGQIEGDEGIHFHGLVSDERRKIELLSRMDTVVVASRDESFSLVALEGAMLSKPLIVTENVGAKYVVDDDNGLVIESGSVEALRDAFIAMMDKDEQSVRAMGAASRRSYDERASMDVYHRDLGAMFNRRIEAGAVGRRRDWARLEVAAKSPKAGVRNRPQLIVSLTSIPTRTHVLGTCIDSLLQQTMPADQVVLWLSTQNFPRKEADLPQDLVGRVGDGFRIAWVDGDIAPHKKYFYAMQKYPDALVITVDDDVVYSENLVESLYQGHLENPRAIISERANLVMFRPDGSLREYDGWIYNCQFLRGTQSYQLLPTGIAGVLYPPGALPKAAFDVDAIQSTSLRADDLWLKVMATMNGYPVWMPRKEAGYETIEEVQSVGLWRANSFQGGNDAALNRVLDHVQNSLGVSRDALLQRIRGVAEDGRMIGPDDIDTAPLI
ncbi:glycosyltransferase [Nocardioides sp. NPDC047086]|uniref:glycosyltransferase n=1 Tax=Nocardioides sp. NPDC047086 TaxID=3154810 RepID=UPI00340C4520